MHNIYMRWFPKKRVGVALAALLCFGMKSKQPEVRRAQTQQQVLMHKTGLFALIIAPFLLIIRRLLTQKGPIRTAAQCIGGGLCLLALLPILPMLFGICSYIINQATNLICDLVQVTYSILQRAMFI